MPEPFCPICGETYSGSLHISAPAEPKEPTDA